jgi:hypothetical protein
MPFFHQLASIAPSIQNCGARMKAQVSNLKAEIALRETQLSEGSRRDEEMCQRYEGLLQVLSSPGLQELSMPYATNENADLEIQQWNLTWSHLISMATQVIDYGEITANSDHEKRTILTDIIARLCDAAADRKKTREKCRRYKEAFRRLTTRGDTLLHEVKRNKAILESHRASGSVPGEGELAGQICQLQGLLKRQHESETRSRRTAVSKGVIARAEEEDVDDVSRCKPKTAGAVWTGRGLRQRNRGGISTHVNELVDLTNQLRDDYYRLGQYFGVRDR